MFMKLHKHDVPVELSSLEDGMGSRCFSGKWAELSAAEKLSYEALTQNHKSKRFEDPPPLPKGENHVLYLRYGKNAKQKFASVF